MHEMLDCRSLRVVKWIVVAGIVASLAHFTDNAFEIGRYPEPSWITPSIVLSAWIPDAIVAIAALLRKNGDIVFVTLSAIFGVLLLTGLAHYAYGSASHMVFLSNFTIVFEAVSGGTLLVTLARAVARRS